jgi:hypothetical protein
MTKPLNVGKVLVERLKRFTENMEIKLMTRLTLDLTTKQINILFKALESLERNSVGDNELSADIIKLTRYLDSVVFVEKWYVENK